MNLTDEQLFISSYSDGPAIVISVPGSGKTTILLKRIENLIANGVEPKKILTITFSKAAATELKERFKKSNRDLKLNPSFFTIHAFSFKILSNYAKNKGFELKLLEENKNSNKYKLLRDFYFKINGEYPSFEKLESIENKISYIKNMMLEEEVFSDSKNYSDNFKSIFKMYEDFKRKYKYIDFDDMLSLTYKILKEEKYYLTKYENLFDYIQVDEGQDTSKIQLEIIKLLTKKRKNLFIVADDDQSIYGFRGANPDGLFSLKETFPEIKIFHMDKNFRSSKNIVIAANKFIGKNIYRFQKELTAQRDFNIPVQISKFKNINEQYEFILEKLNSKNLRDVAVFYRNNISSLPLMAFLEKNDIPFKVSENSGVSFFENRVSKDLFDIINFSKSQNDIPLFEKIYFKTDGYISREMINSMKKEHGFSNIFDGLSELSGLKSYQRNYIAEIQSKYNLLSKIPVFKKIEFIGKDLGYLKYLKEMSSIKSFGFSSQVLIYEVLKKISENSKSLEEFEGHLKFLDYKIKEKTESGINLSTVHSAKGKEFKYVFLIDLFDGNFPSNFSKEKSFLLEEERRLFYVAMTRAKDELYLMYPSEVFSKKVNASQFLKELSESFSK